MATAPGVYVKEIPSGTRNITAAGTSVAAFLGFAPTGPIQPTRIASWTEFTELYQQTTAVPTAFTHANRPAKVVGSLIFSDGLYLVSGGEAKIHKCDLTGGHLDPGIPIRNKFSNAYTENIDTAIARTYYGHTNFLTKGNNAFKEGTGRDTAITNYFHDLPSAFADGWSAADGNDKVTYIFKGDSYLEYDNGARRPRGAARKIADGFPALPPDFHSGLDGAVVVDNVLYLFKGKETQGVMVEDPPGVLADAVYGYFANGGGPCWVVRIPVDKPGGGPLDKAELVKCFTGTSAVWPGTGLAGLEGVGEVTMVAAPDIWSIRGVTADDVKPVQQAVVKHCAQAGNRMAILDPPKATAPGDVAKYPGSLSLPTGYRSFAAVYYPWLRVPPVRGGAEVLVPPAGAVAGVWCRTDARRGVHKAPANESLAAVAGLERMLSDTDQAELNPVGVNCLRCFPGEGIVVWGARTLSGTDDWRYVNVRRLVSHISASLEAGTAWAVFEPNDERLWASLATNVTVFLTGLWREGALKGHTAAEAFYVICDETNNPPEGRAAGRVVCDIGIAAVRPAEFVHFTLTQITTTRT
ncbi:phage tail sheath C-terminal domain-containing protein [Nocardia terpenica]|uniref:Phage tail protein n=1 Tax=Nocardia terpenica TaxID=455432 RepID=A0A6G9ZDL1_9NOCA|nr:phage tail sheath C-terminal domain-containing protein [Nocardia terpenica]QIS23534.1 hypothetical protein F6W96_39860 [Nocardia terpenica]